MKRQITNFALHAIAIMLIGGCDLLPNSKSLILGTWKGTIVEEDFTGTVSTRFTEDKRWSQSMNVKLGGFIPMDATASGEWDIENEILIMKVFESSFEDLLPEGYIMSSKILSISQERITLDEDGKIRTYDKVLANK